MKTKKFDCIEMKRYGAAIIYKKSKNMIRDEQLDYWEKGTEELKKQHFSTLKGNTVHFSQLNV